MKVLYVNTYFHGGGAEKVMRQLYNGMQTKDIVTYCMVGRVQNDIPSGVQIIYEDFWGRAVTTAIGSTLRNTLLKTYVARKRIIEFVQKENIDIVHFHNLHSNYIGISDIIEIKKYCKHIIVTLHDMWILTGGCAHACECEKWINNECRQCKGNYSMQSFSYSSKMFQYKKKYFENKGIYFVTPSMWLADLCKSGYLKNENLQVIHNGIDLGKYKTCSKPDVRNKYGLPQEKKILIFVANGLNNIYKGFPYLKKALDMIEEKEKYALLIVGNKKDEQLEFPFEMYPFGYVSCEKKMNELYAAADLYIHPSMADVYPFTPMESIASGTPVLAFSTGGIPEIVDEEVGWLVSPGDSVALKNKIEDIFAKENQTEYMEKQKRCESYSQENFNIEYMIDKYKKLYIQLTDKGD